MYIYIILCISIRITPADFRYRNIIVFSYKKINANFVTRG